MALVLFGWSAWRKVGERVKMRIAKRLDFDTPDDVIEAKAKAMPVSEQLSQAFHDDKGTPNGK